MAILVIVLKETQNSCFHGIVLFLDDAPDYLPVNIHSAAIGKLVSD